MDSDQRAKISQLLEAVVAADGVIKPEERAFVRRAIERWKLPVPEAPQSLRSLGNATNALRTLEPEAQSRVLALLVDAATVDGEVDPREHALLLAAAAALGIDATALEARIVRQLGAARG
ncbi:MAG: TerB family tellurite resistance protein [Polyangiaceae bacterium]|nr:TerB family tellurite resistance protein [Polyangiaceae bacterium]